MAGPHGGPHVTFDQVWNLLVATNYYGTLASQGYSLTQLQAVATQIYNNLQTDSVATGNNGDVISKVFMKKFRAATSSGTTGNPTTPPPTVPNITINTGSSKPAIPDYASYIGSYTKWLTDHEIKIDSNLKNLMQNAAHAGSSANPTPWNLDEFITHVRQTNEYQKRFVGIYNPNGTLKMTEDQYLSYEDQYKQYASAANIDLNKKDLGQLFKGNVDLQKFQTRAQAVGTLQQNKDYFDQFKEEVKALGGKPPSDNQLLQWVMSKGESNKEWTKLWNAASVRYQASQAGFNVSQLGNKGAQNGDLGLTNKDILSISQEHPREDLTQSFQKLAQTAQKTLPLSRWGAWGISKQDLVELEFGGSRQASIAAKVNQILQNADATANASPYAAGAGQGIGQRQSNE